LADLISGKRSISNVV